MNELQIFNNEKFGAVRTAKNIGFMYKKELHETIIFARL